jgi:hypothetical protein
VTTINPGSRPNAADLDAARLLLDRLGVSPADLLASRSERAPVPTFAEYGDRRDTGETCQVVG